MTSLGTLVALRAALDEAITSLAPLAEVLAAWEASGRPTGSPQGGRDAVLATPVAGNGLAAAGGASAVTNGASKRRQGRPKQTAEERRAKAAAWARTKRAAQRAPAQPVVDERPSAELEMLPDFPERPFRS